jgi:hypothetical protein
VVEADDGRVARLVPLSVPLVDKIIEVEVALRPAREDVSILESRAGAAREVEIGADRGVHVRGDGPVEALGNGQPLRAGETEPGQEETRRPLLQGIAQVREVKNGNAFHPDDGVPHLQVVVFFQVGLGQAEAPARVRLGAGRDPGLFQAVEVGPPPLEGFGFEK